MGRLKTLFWALLTVTFISGLFIVKIHEIIENNNLPSNVFYYKKRDSNLVINLHTTEGFKNSLILIFKKKKYSLV